MIKRFLEYWSRMPRRKKLVLQSRLSVIVFAALISVGAYSFLAKPGIYLEADGNWVAKRFSAFYSTSEVYEQASHHCKERNKQISGFKTERQESGQAVFGGGVYYHYFVCSKSTE